MSNPYRTQETGITTIIGKDYRVDQNEYSARATVSFGRTQSGVIQRFLFVSTEEKEVGGAVQTPAGKLYVFDADPQIASGATEISAAVTKTIIGVVDLSAGDWVSDDNGATAYITDTPVYFHRVSALYFSFLLTSATSMNDGATDDEVLQLNAWYQCDSV